MTGITNLDRVKGILLRRMKPDTCRLILTLCIVLFTAGCGDARQPVLQTVPAPSLDGLHPQIADHIRAMRERLSSLASTGRPPAEIATAYGLAGQTFHTYGILDAARASYLVAQRADSNDYRWPYYLGRVYQQLGQVEAAIVQFQQSFGIKPDYAPTALSLARLLHETNRTPAAVSVLERILAADPHNASANYILGQIQLDAGDPSGAVSSLQAALVAQPGATRIHYLLATAYQQLGDSERAQRHLGLRGDGDVTYADPLMAEVGALNRGVKQTLEAGAAAFRRGDLASAEKYFRQATMVDTEHTVVGQAQSSALLAEAHHALGLVLVKLGNAQEAEANYREALQLNPRFVAAHYDIALLQDILGEFEDAIHHYEQVVHIEPHYRDARFRLANNLVKAGHCEGALGYLEQVLEQTPGHKPSRELQTRCLK